MLFQKLCFSDYKLFMMSDWELRGGEVSLILSENSDYVEPFILSLAQSTGASILKISHQQSHLDWAEICGDRGWTRLDKDYPQLLRVKGMLCWWWSGSGDTDGADGVLTNIWGQGPDSDHRGASPPSIIASHKTLLKTSSGVCSMFARCSQYLFIEHAAL